MDAPPGETPSDAARTRNCLSLAPQSSTQEIIVWPTGGRYGRNGFRARAPTRYADEDEVRDGDDGGRRIPVASQQSRVGKQGALIVGASSGIGAALARRLVADGCRVALVARRQEELDVLARDLNTMHGAAPDNPLALAYATDVTDYEAAPGLFVRIFNELAPLRVVVYAAGVMPPVVT